MFRVTPRKRKLARNVFMDYVVVEFERPHRIVARGISSEVFGVDTFTVSPTAVGGSEVVYKTDIELRGLGKAMTLFAGRLVNKSGDKTRAGLERALNPG